MTNSSTSFSEHILQSPQSGWPDSAVDYAITWSAFNSADCIDTKWRLLPYWVFLNVRKGQYRCSFESGELVCAGPGEALIIPSFHKHKLEVDPHTVADGFHIQYSLFQSLDFLSYFSIPKFFGGKDPYSVNDSIATLAECHAKNVESSSLSNLARLKSAAFNLLAELLDSSLLLTEDEYNLTRMKKVLPAIRFIEQQLASSIRVEQLAALCAMSKNGFSRLFKQIMGDAPLVFINKKRLDFAMTKLAYTDESIFSIAESSGFSDQFYFSSRFREHVGQSPRQYRANIRPSFTQGKN